MTAMVRRFIFYTPADWQRFVAFIKANIKPMAEQERWLQAVVSEYKASRSAEQNAYMWVGLLGPTSEQATANGQRLSDEGWNLMFKCLLLPEVNAKGMDKWLYLPDGSRQLLMSTTDLNHAEMDEYLTKTAAYAATELGVQLPVNPRDL
jgi:hypothetical protein